MIYDKEDWEDIEALHPAITLANKVRELFKKDPAIKLYWNEDKYTIYFYITDLKKAEAVRYILPEVYEISDCAKLYIEIYYKIDNDTKVLVGRTHGYHYNPNIFCKAFEGNPLWVYIHVWEHKTISNAHCWAGFLDEAITYPEDNLEDLYGFSSYLPADLAKAVLDVDGMHICTYNSGRSLIRRNTVANSIYEDSIDWNYDE